MPHTTKTLIQTALAVLVTALWTPGAAQLAAPTNISAPQQQSSSDIVIFQAGSVPITSQRLLRPLTSAAGLNASSTGQPIQLIGQLTSVDTSNYNTATVNRTISLLSCDPAAYPGFINVTTVFSQIYDRGPSAIILYSNASTDSGCVINIPDGSSFANGMIYTTTSQMDVSVFLQANNQAATNKVPFVISQRGIADNNSGSTTNTTQSSTGSNGSPLNSTSPSTAVAMIILYSITGVITALFLVIIITGAVRAHRHPERYGPRTGLGRRPGQSRARGLARAMLDTIPIVKFGEKDEDKDETGAGGVVGTGARDVEMAGGVLEPVADQDKTGTDDDDESEEQNGDHSQNRAIGKDATVAGASDTNAAEADGDVDAIATTGEPKGKERSSTSDGGEQRLSPTPTAQPVAENLGCSICTEDFERGQDVRILPCNHQFHPACIDPWLLNVSGTCPLCRIDLRPNADNNPSSRRSSLSGNHELPPPIDPDGDGTTSAAPTRHLYPSANPVRRSSRRGSSIMADIRDILNPRTMGEASTQERIAALRVVRERNADEDVRRRRRLTAKLQDVFHVRTLRGRSPAPPTQAGSSLAEELAGQRGSVVGRGTPVRDSVAEVPEPTEELATSSSPASEPHTSGLREVSDPTEETETEEMHQHNISEEPEASSPAAVEQASSSKPEVESSMTKKEEEESENKPSSSS